MEFTTSGSDVIAVFALLVSGYVAWQQRSLNASQKRLNDLLLEQGESQVRDSQKADLGASFIKLGSSKYRLKVWNQGKSKARNVRIEFPDGNDVLIPSDVESKFPLEVLEQHHSVELIAAVHMGTKSKHHIKLIWEDDYGRDNEKSVYPTL